MYCKKTLEDAEEENKQLIIEDRDEIERLNRRMIVNCYNEVFSNDYDTLVEIAERYECENKILGNQ